MKKAVLFLLAGFIGLILTGCAELERVNMDYYGVSGGSSAKAKPGKTGKATCPDCKAPLTYIQDYQRWYCDSEAKYMDEGFDPNKRATPPPPAPKAPPAPPRPAAPAVKDPCPNCGKTLTYIPDYQRWYCDSEGTYMDEGFQP
ncbi:MAG: hypothetical protein A2252_05300 [Elusimicrobia bacterium RIFOXYA2_FULL_39_19]|nr:MAG: hypothetical protein A2252_05300 [Elusimicrobia bacterium RIFOXYA2_FULL_39_19]